jgi:hypothetical protein
MGAGLLAVICATMETSCKVGGVLDCWVGICQRALTAGTSSIRHLERNLRASRDGPEHLQSYVHPGRADTTNALRIISWRPAVDHAELSIIVVPIHGGKQWLGNEAPLTSEMSRTRAGRIPVMQET